MSWLLNLAYLLLGIVASPWLIYRRFRLGKRIGNWREKLLGQVPQRSTDRDAIWLHAVSVGEVVQLGSVIERLQSSHPDADIVISTTTTTGQEVARKLYGAQHRIIYFPFDFTWAVSTALHRLQPSLIVLVELELWPNFLTLASRRKIPLVLINGRVSDRSYGSYQWIRPLTRRMLRPFRTIAAQNQTYADRLANLGARPEQLVVTGSIKFDRVETNRANPQTEALRQTFQLSGDDVLLIAGSTQAPEEQLAIQTYQALRTEFPQLRLMLVPRHKERFAEVAGLVEQSGLPLLRRSQMPDSGSQVPDSRRLVPDESVALKSDTLSLISRPVLLLDTLGELSAAWGLAHIAFVGGSLTRRGGQNMIEPSGYGAAVLFGPHTHNFKDIVAILLDAQAAQVVPNAVSLTPIVRELLQSPSLAQAMGTRAQRLVLVQRGATETTVRLILEALDAHPQPALTPDIVERRAA